MYTYLHTYIHVEGDDLRRETKQIDIMGYMCVLCRKDIMGYMCVLWVICVFYGLYVRRETKQIHIMSYMCVQSR